MSADLAQPLTCSVGVMAYNEEGNIARAIDSILGQDPDGERIAEVIVVASGCTDRTADIVTDIALRESRVRLIEQARREGKASAVNLFIGAGKAPLLALISADVRLADGSFEAMMRHFDDPSVGMVGGRPVPVNDAGSFLGHAVHLQWRLHDRIARQSPKLGEMVAFRNVVPTIPMDTAVDELSIQALVTQLGYRLVYEPQAAVYNRGPATVQDFLRQRRRIHAGHLKIRNRQAYAAPTMSAWRAGVAMLEPELFASPRALMWSLGTIGLEAYARALGRYDVIRGHRTHTVWEMVGSTKDQIDDTAAHRQHVVVIFHVANFHLIELDLGAHAARQLARRVADHIQQTLGSSVRVSAQEAGTTIAVLSGDRAAAEEAAGAVVRHFAQAPVQAGGKGTATPVTLTCGIVSFPQPGPQPGPELPAPRIEQFESNPATPATT